MHVDMSYFLQIDSMEDIQGDIRLNFMFAITKGERDPVLNEFRVQFPKLIRDKPRRLGNDVTEAPKIPHNVTEILLSTAHAWSRDRLEDHAPTTKISKMEEPGSRLPWQYNARSGDRNDNADGSS